MIEFTQLDQQTHTFWEHIKKHQAELTKYLCFLGGYLNELIPKP